MGSDWQLRMIRDKLGDNNPNTVRIALMHHPPSWFWIADAPLLEHNLPVDFDFCLHGHEHMTGQFVDPARSFARLAAGACYSRQGDLSGIEAFRYNIVEYDVRNKIVHVWPREFRRSQPQWASRDVDEYPGKHMSFFLDLNESQNLPPRSLDRDPDETADLSGLWETDVKFEDGRTWSRCDVRLNRLGPRLYAGEGYGIVGTGRKKKQYRFSLSDLRVLHNRNICGTWHNTSTQHHGVLQLRIKHNLAELEGRFITSGNNESKQEVLDHGLWHWRKIEQNSE